jgi:hypothetical protein
MKREKQRYVFIIFLLFCRDMEPQVGMDHFFRSLPFQPYAYTLYPDGTEVGKYTPNYTMVRPQVKQVTKEKFMNTAKYRTNPIAKKISHP